MTSPWSRATLNKEVAETLRDEIKGKNIVITGVTIGGLGFEAAYAIAQYAASVIIVGRNLEKLRASEEKIRAEKETAKILKVVADFSSLKSVRQAAAEINAFGVPIHVVITNAIAPLLKEYTVSAEGHELQFAVDHLAHFLLVDLIFPSILTARSEHYSPRVVVVSSFAHRLSPVRFDDLSFGDGKEYKWRHAYAQAKSANMLFAKELAKRGASKGVLAFPVHPGAVLTNGLKNMTDQQKKESYLFDPEGTSILKMFEPKALDTAATTYIVAAFDPTIRDRSGSYLLEDGQIHDDAVVPHASDPENAVRLWELSERLVGEKFEV